MRARSSRPRWTMVLLIFICSARSRSEGSLSPGLSVPEKIMPSIRSMNSSFIVGATICPKSKCSPSFLVKPIVTCPGGQGKAREGKSQKKDARHSVHSAACPLFPRRCGVRSARAGPASDVGSGESSVSAINGTQRRRLRPRLARFASSPPRLCGRARRLCPKPRTHGSDQLFCGDQVKSIAY